MPDDTLQPMVTQPQAEGAGKTLERVLQLPVMGGQLVGWASGAGARILLLHGGPGITDPLAALATELAQPFRVVHYQQRGVPPSVTSGDRSVEGHVADALSVLDALGWERPWVVGYSWGGYLAMHLAVARPERLAGFAVIGTLGAVGDGGAEAMSERLLARLQPTDRARVEEINAREEAGEASLEEALEALHLLWPHYAGRPDRAAPWPDGMTMDLTGAAQTWASIADHFERRTLERGLPRLTLPAVFVHGDADPIPVDAIRATAALVPGATLRVLPGVGHFPWTERPGAVVEILREVIGSAGGIASLER